MVTSTGAAGSAEGTLCNDDLPAAFWDAYPENPDNADLQAINALLEESTPKERADTYKVRCPACASDTVTVLTRQRPLFYVYYAEALVSLRRRENRQHCMSADGCKCSYHSTQLQRTSWQHVEGLPRRTRAMRR